MPARLPFAALGDEPHRKLLCARPCASAVLQPSKSPASYSLSSALSNGEGGQPTAAPSPGHWKAGEGEREGGLPLAGTLVL